MLPFFFEEILSHKNREPMVQAKIREQSAGVPAFGALLPVLTGMAPVGLVNRRSCPAISQITALIFLFSGSNNKPHHEKQHHYQRYQWNYHNTLFSFEIAKPCHSRLCHTMRLFLFAPSGL
jgi:hypothetical protein